MSSTWRETKTIREVGTKLEERERYRQIQGGTDRYRERQTDRYRERQTDTGRDRQGETDRQTDRGRDRQGETDREIGGETWDPTTKPSTK